MATKKVQVGWIFRGSNVVASTGYRKEYFFPAGVSTTMERRGDYWNDKSSEGKPDQIFDMTARTGSSWDYEAEKQVGEKFEVIQIERLNGKITTTIIIPEPYMEDIKCDDDSIEEEVE